MAAGRGPPAGTRADGGEVLAARRTPDFPRITEGWRHGTQLTAAAHVIHLDRWWNPAVEDQATDRAFRIGQKRNVQVHKLVRAGTAEERIDAMITANRDLATRVVGMGEQWLTQLSTIELGVKGQLVALWEVSH